MEFQITEEHRRWQDCARSLAKDFSTRAAEHDRDASHPLENYLALREAGWCAARARGAGATPGAEGRRCLGRRGAGGGRGEGVWATRGRRAARSDSMILGECRVPEEAGRVQTNDKATWAMSYAALRS